MIRDEVLNVRRMHKATVVQRFGVTELALFGSLARGQDVEDVDILVRFDGPTTSEAYFDAQFYLEDLLGIQSICSPTRRCGRNCVPMWSGRSSMSNEGLFETALQSVAFHASWKAMS